MVVYIFVILVFLVFSTKWPDFMFWLAVVIYLDPGGYVQLLIPREMIGGLQRTDLTFPLLFFPLISKKVDIGIFFRSKLNIWIISFLLIYTLFYHILVYGIIASNSFIAALELLQYQRLTLIAFLCIIPGYIFFYRNYTLLFKFAFYSSLILMLLYVITLLTPVKILPLLQFERSQGSGISRIAVMGYGFAQWFIYIAIIMISAKLDLPFRKAILILAVLVLGAELLTLTRRVYFIIGFQFVFIVWIYQKFRNRNFLNKSILRITLFALVGIILLTLIFPISYRNITAGITDTYSIVSKGTDAEGEKDTRITSDIPKHLARFKQSPIIGYGWDKNWYSNLSEEGGLSANDSPVTAALGMFGILGLAIYSIYYFKLVKILKNTFRLLKDYYNSGLYKNRQLLFALCFFLFTSISSYLIVYFMSLFSDLIVGYSRSTAMLSISFLLAGRQIVLNDLGISPGDKEPLV